MHTQQNATAMTASKENKPRWQNLAKTPAACPFCGGAIKYLNFERLHICTSCTFQIGPEKFNKIILDQMDRERNQE